MIVRCLSAVVILQFSINMILSTAQITRDQKIVGGQTTVEAAPYQISMQTLNNKTGHLQHFCGGSILSEKHIVTAAHCLSNRSAESITIVVGTSIWDHGGLRHSVKKYEIHENYQKLETCDIGIVTLVIPLEFNEKVQPIAFNDDYVPGDASCILTGWGSMYPVRMPSYVLYWFVKFLRIYPKDLQITQLQTISNEKCRKIFPDKKLTSELCTYTWSKGACAGDSGGPVVNLERNLLVGIVSFGSVNCGGFTGIPDINTRLSNFTTWIKERIEVH